MAVLRERGFAVGFGDSVLLFTRRQQVLVCPALPVPLAPAAAAHRQEPAGPDLLPGVSLLPVLGEVSAETLWRLVLKQHVVPP